MPLHRYCVCLALAIAELAVASIIWAGDIRTIVISGQHAAGTPEGVAFGWFGAPSLNDHGDVAFRGILNTDGGNVVDATARGVWATSGGNLGLVARGGDPAPGTPSGAVFREPEETVYIADNGDVAFVGRLQIGPGGVTTTNNFGIWEQAGSTLNLVARYRDPAPGVPGAVFSRVGTQVQPSDPHTFRHSRSGIVAFDSSLTNAPGESVIPNGQRNAVWTYGNAGDEMVIRSGSQAPGTPTDALLSRFGVPSVNSAGHVAFQGFLIANEGGVTSANDSGIWSNGRGSLELIARKGSPAVGFETGEQFYLFSSISLNDDGDLAFMAIARGQSQFDSKMGIWSTVSGELGLLAGPNTPAPGTVGGGTFSQPVSVVLNSAGNHAFASYVTGPPGLATNAQYSDLGIWTDVGEEIHLIARTGLRMDFPDVSAEYYEGTPVPGKPEGTRFFSFGPVILNAGGQVAFGASIRSSGSTPVSSGGIWAQDINGDLQLIVAKGDQIDIDNGAGVDLRTVDIVNLLGDTGNADGKASGFNDRGQIAFSARFTDNTWGVFVSNAVANLDPLPGDFDHDGDVDGRDFLQWQRGDSLGGSGGNLADWQNNYGVSSIADNVAVPEPESVVALSLMIAAAAVRRGKKAG